MRRDTSRTLVVRQELTNKSRLVGVRLAGRPESRKSDAPRIDGSDSSMNREQDSGVPAVRSQRL